MKPRWVIGTMLAVAAWLFLLGLCLAADPLNPPPPAIDGPTQVASYKILDIKAAGDWETAVWKIDPAGADARFSTDGKTVTFVAPPGVYTVSATLVNWTQKKLLQASHAVTIGPAPAPPAPPAPKPVPPPPAPTERIPAGRLWLLCILPDVNRQTPAQGAIPASAALHKLLDAQGNHFRWVDPQTAPPELSVWIERAKKAGLPRALIVDAAPGGSLVKESAPLTSAADTLSLLQKWGGK